MIQLTEEEKKHPFTQQMQDAWQEACNAEMRRYFAVKRFWETKNIDGKEVKTGVELFPRDIWGKPY